MLDEVAKLPNNKQCFINCVLTTVYENATVLSFPHQEMHLFLLQCGMVSKGSNQPRCCGSIIYSRNRKQAKRKSY